MFRAPGRVSRAVREYSLRMDRAHTLVSIHSVNRDRKPDLWISGEDVNYTFRMLQLCTAKALWLQKGRGRYLQRVILPSLGDSSVSPRHIPNPSRHKLPFPCHLLTRQTDKLLFSANFRPHRHTNPATRDGQGATRRAREPTKGE
jgi:hypothetical protein